MKSCQLRDSKAESIRVEKAEKRALLRHFLKLWTNNTSDISAVALLMPRSMNFLKPLSCFV